MSLTSRTFTKSQLFMRRISNIPRTLPPNHPRANKCRLFATNKKPDWMLMQQAEMDYASSANNNKPTGTPSNVMRRISNIPRILPPTHPRAPHHHQYRSFATTNKKPANNKTKPLTENPISNMPRFLPPTHPRAPHHHQHRSFATTNKKPDWEIQAEMEALSANKTKTLNGDPNNVMMSKLEHEFASERVHNAMKLEDKLKMLIKKCNENRGDRKLFNAIRTRAMTARQELIVQREAAGMAKNSVLNAETVEATFPIPGSM